MQSGKIYKNQGVRKDGTFTLTTDQLGKPLTTSGILTNEANVGFEVPEGQSKYLTAGNDVVDLSKLDGSGFSVNIGDAFSSDNDKVTVMAGALQKNNLKLTSIENLEIINSGVTTSVTLTGANFKGLEAVKLIGDGTTLSVSDFTYGIKVDATENADSISGGFKADTINGGAGNDTIQGNKGNDVLTGGNGADEFIVGNAGDFGIDQILDFSAEDKISMKGFSAQELKKFDASTFSTVTYKTLDSVLATFGKDGANETKNGDVVIFSYDGKTYALLANGPFLEATDALVDITGANVASLTESNFGTNGTFANYAAFKAAVLADEISSTSPVTIKSITADDAALLLTTDESNLAYIDDKGIGAVTGGPVDVTMKKAVSTELDTADFASKLGAGVDISTIKINITGIADAANNITSSFGGTITGGSAADIITVSGTGAVTINGGAGTNTIIGGAGDDRITTTGTGANQITAGAGNDTITLNSTGVDTVVFGADKNANGVDTITGFEAGSSGDKLNISAFTTKAGQLKTADASSASLEVGSTNSIGVLYKDTDGKITASDVVTSSASNGQIQVGSGEKAVVLVTSAASASAGGLYNIYYITGGATATVELVGNVTTTAAALTLNDNFA